MVKSDYKEFDASSAATPNCGQNVTKMTKQLHHEALLSWFSFKE